MSSENLILSGLAADRLLANDDFRVSWNYVMADIQHLFINTPFGNKDEIERVMALKEGVSYAFAMMNHYVQAMHAETSRQRAESGGQSENEFGFDDGNSTDE